MAHPKALRQALLIELVFLLELSERIRKPSPKVHARQACGEQISWVKYHPKSPTVEGARLSETISNVDEHRAFVEAYARGEVRMGFRRTRIHATTRTRYRELFKAAPDYPAMLNTLATAASALIIPCIVAGMTLPFVVRWWLAAPCAGLALAFSALSYGFQREAIRELALSSSTAYKFLYSDSPRHLLGPRVHLFFRLAAHGVGITATGVPT